MKNFKNNDTTDYGRSLGFSTTVAGDSRDADFYEEQERPTLRVFAPPTEKDDRARALRDLINAVEDLRTAPAFWRLDDVHRKLDAYENAVVASGGFR